MHLTEVASQVHARLGQVLHGEPMATKYEVVADLAKSGSCCGGGDGHGAHRGHEPAAANEPDRCSLAATARCGRSSFLREPSSKSDPDAHADRRVSRWAPNALLMHWLVFTGTARPTSKRRR